MMELFRQYKQETQLLGLGVPALLVGLGILCALPLLRVGVLWAALWTGAILCAIYVYGQRVALPLLRTERLYRQLLLEESETFSGVVRGWKAGQISRRGVMMDVLEVDAGDAFRGKPVLREVCVPAVLRPEVSEGKTISFRAREGIALSLSPCAACAFAPQGGRYALSPLVMAGLLLLTGVLWAGGWGLYERVHRPATVAMAVCTPAHHREAEAALQDALADRGLPRCDFSYTNTLDRETVYSYLATYGALDAQCLLLPEADLLSVFEGDVPPLSDHELSAFPDLKLLYNEKNESVAVVLYDPADQGYSARFAPLIDWIAVPRDGRYVLALAPQGDEEAAACIYALVAYLLGEGI